MSSGRVVEPNTVAVTKGQPEADGKPALSPVFRNVGSKDGWVGVGGTLYEMFQQSVEKFGIEPCLGYRPIKDGVAGPYVWSTYREVDATANKVLGGLRSLGVAPGESIGIYSHNCPQFTLVILAANRGSNAVVPLYDSLGEDAVAYTANHSGSVAIFAAEGKLAPLIAAGPSIRPGVHSIVYWGKPNPDAASKLQALGFAVYFWEDFLVLGEQNPASPTPPKPETIATIMYTSGTTGTPKGVVLTHGNIMATVTGAQKVLGHEGLNVGPGDSLLSYLTLAHIFGRIMEEGTLSLGGCIGYWQGDVKKLSDDLKALRPTIFASVPRVLERFESAIKAKIGKAPWPLRVFFDWAVKVKGKIIATGIRTVFKATPILDLLLFNKTKQAVGGRMRIIFSGGAPLSPATGDFLEATLCCPILQGYGLTETCGISFVGNPVEIDKSSVGGPTTALEFRLEGSAELGYDPLGTPARGEVCLRGPQIFSGYYKDPERTKEAFDEDGFFHTGDVGEVTNKGSLKIIDRIKNMFKLAQGEYVAAEKLESVYTGADIVDQIWVYGDSYEAFLVAIVIPEKERLFAWAKSQGLKPDLEALAANPKAGEYITKEVGARAKETKLKGFEVIAAVHIETEPWTVENGLVTPSFKLKRPALKKKYADVLAQLYVTTKAKKGS